jgi:hypothetical protein
MKRAQTSATQASASRAGGLGGAKEQIPPMNFSRPISHKEDESGPVEGACVCLWKEGDVYAVGMTESEAKPSSRCDAHAPARCW